MYLITTEEALALLEKWETGRLPKEDWTHEMHVVMGFSMLVFHGPGALPAMRERIIRHNEAVGTVNSDSSGYHETMTVYWLWLIRNFMLEKGLSTFDEAALDELVFERSLAKRNGWLDFYKEETIKSVAARRGFVPPDFGEMKGIDWFFKKEEDPQALLFREATVADVPQLMEVRFSVKENVLSNPALVTEADCIDFITRRGRGWVCEAGGRIAGFSIIDWEENNVWALFLRPEFEGRGIGRELHRLMLDGYFSKTGATIWLGTAPGTRAEAFYKKAGWREVGLRPNGEVRFEMDRADWPPKK